jgi:L-asparagine oxygenase
MSEDTIEYVLSDREASQVADLADRVRALGEDPVDPGFYDRCWQLREDMPAGLRRFLSEFRQAEPAACCLVRGVPVDDSAIGPTPGTWRACSSASGTALAEVFIALCGSALGEPFAWSSLQAGRMIQDIVPVRGDEYRQSGHGSESPLEFHTEDGFHPLRCDYLLLFGVRNQDAVPTTLASVRDLRLSGEQAKVLGEPRFAILPDTEHIRQLEMTAPDHPALARMKRLHDEPEPTPVLFGDPASPYIRLDLPFMRCLGDDPAAKRALGALLEAIEAAAREVVVGPGTLLIVDNYLCVHGRPSFRPRYDGTDRWLKKLTVSRNLRRSLGFHATTSARVIF